MADIPITRVRYSQQEGAERLRLFIFGGYRSGPRVPRGVDPAVASEVIRDDIAPDARPEVYQKTLAVIRFYELVDTLPSLGRALQSAETSTADVRRSAYAIQAVGDLGEREDVDDMAETFNTRLVGHPKAFEAVDTLLETTVVLAPSGTPDQLFKRIDEEVQHRKEHEDESEEAMRACQLAGDVQRMKVPQTQLCIDHKTRLAQMETPERIHDLIEIYLGRSPVSDDLMMTWAGRRLRQVAMENDPEPIYAAFADVISQAEAEKIGRDPLTDTLVARSAQAILYLNGKLSVRQRERYENTTQAAMSFLWDDLQM